MKKLIFVLFCLLIYFNSFAQPIIDFYDECIEPKPNSSAPKYLCSSENGYWFPTKGTYRMLVIFINIIYDVTPNLNPNVVNPSWPVTNQEGINLQTTLQPIKQYFDDVWDVNNTLPRQGFFTRFMTECSFDNLVILGDFTTVEIKQSRIQANGGSFSYDQLMNSVITYINNYVYPSTNTNSGLQAYYGHNSIADYDKATIGYAPTLYSNNALDFVSFFVLNPTKTHGGFASGGVTGSNLGYSLKLSNGIIYPIESWTVFSVGGGHLKYGAGILVHEFAHGLLGSNAFHTSGGNHLGSSEVNTFIFKQNGNGLFYNTFYSCNAYERWRLGWQHPSNSSNKIAATGNSSDISSKFSGTRTFYLRDFNKYGDAIRIKLPYKDSDDASNQYIWLENRQFGRNGKLDGFGYHSYPGVNCILLGTPGIYSFTQVGRDVLEGENNFVFFTNEKDNLRMISAEGNYNMTYLYNKNDCIPWTARPTFEYTNPNPLSGINDQNEGIITQNQNLQIFSDFTYIGNKIINGILYNQLISHGDIFDAFVSGSVMDLSSNPPPINAYTYYASYSNDYGYNKKDDYRDTRKKYLTGLSIKMNYAYTLSDGTEVFKVDICWDDYDVKEDVNWAGNIVLKEKVNVLSNNTITFEQNKTVYQINRDPVSGVFAPPTLFTCEDNSVFVQQPNSHVFVKEKGKILLKSGSKYSISSGANLTIKSGCTLEVEDCAILEIKGELVVENGANIIFHPNTVIIMQDISQIVYSGNVHLLIYPYVWINPKITTNFTISQPITFNNNVIIQSGATLTLTSTMKMGANCSILIQPGGKLIVDGGTLTNSCPDKLWQGIYVAGNSLLPQTAQNQGTLELKNNALIENARNAIATYNVTPSGDVDWNNTFGGIVKADNATFKNNRRSAEFMSYQNNNGGRISPNVSYFKNCKFIVDDTNLFANCNCTILSQITMWDVTGVKINGCTFTNSRTDLSARNRAIYTENAGYVVDEYCIGAFDPITCQCRGAQPSTFKGFENAIESLNSTKQYAISIDRSNFTNNITGIKLTGKNSFQLSRLNMDMNNLYSSYPAGIYLDGCTGYKIEGNNIYSNGNGYSTGIWVEIPGSNENRIYRNIIHHAQYGIKVTNPFIVQPLRNFPATGLQFVCNDLQDNNYDILVQMQASIRATQGSSSCGADNLFTSPCIYNFYVGAQPPQVNYYRDPSVPRKDPVCKSGITVSNATKNPCNETLCDGSLQDTTGSGWGNGKSSFSLLTKYHELKNKYSEMLNHFYAKGYDKILTDYYNGIIENEELLKEAMLYHEAILAVTESMALLSHDALFALKTDTIIDLHQIRDWYEEIYTLSAKYSLAETYYQLGNFAAGMRTLTLIPEMYKLNEDEMMEHQNYLSLYTFKNDIAESGRTIAQLTEDEIIKMQYFAEATSGLSSKIAQGILCFFYDICKEDEAMRELEDEEMRGLDDEAIKGERRREKGESEKEDSYGLMVLRSYGLEIFPNPGKDYITVASEVEDCYFELINAMGIVVKSEKINKGNNTINTSSFPQGIYIYKAVAGNNVVTGKWIKN